MKKLSKLVSLILTLTLAACVFGVTAHAEGTPTVSVGSAQASAGDTIKVDVVLSDCEKFSSYTIRISYDSEYVTAVAGKKRVSKGIYQFNPSVDGKKELIIVGGDVDNITEDGPIATIEFKIADNFPGGVTEVPLKIVHCKLTEYKDQKDIEFATQTVDGKLVVTGIGGNVVWNDGEGGESEMTPAKLTDEQAAEYTNPLTKEAVSGGGDYYINEEKKIAIPAADVENGVANDPGTWKVMDNPAVVIDQPGSSEGSDEPQGSEDIASNEGGKFNWLLVACIAGGVIIVVAGALAVASIIRKNKANKDFDEEPETDSETETETDSEE